MDEPPVPRPPLLDLLAVGDGEASGTLPFAGRHPNAHDADGAMRARDPKAFLQGSGRNPMAPFTSSDRRHRTWQNVFGHFSGP